ncbi:YybH family protein [Nonomuraea thailandensis]
MTSSESEIRALLERRVEACQDKDVDRLMSLYSPDVVYYDVVPLCGSRGPRRSAVTSCGGSTSTTAPSAWRPTTSPS